MLGGALAYARTSSVPSLAASFGIGGLMALSSMRIRDGLNFGLEGAACELRPESPMTGRVLSAILRRHDPTRLGKRDGPTARR